MKRVIAPQFESSVPADTLTTSWRLPGSLLSEQVRRIAVAAGVGTALWTYGLVMDTLTRPMALHTSVPARSVAIEIVSIAISVVMLLYARYATHDPRTKTDVALVYFVLNAGSVALLNVWKHLSVDDMSRMLSWNTIVILVAASIIPSSPRKMLVAALVAASMDPLAVWVSHLQGADVPRAIETIVIFMPNYACAAAAVLPPQVLQHLGRRLQHAQDMGSYHLEERLGRGGMGEVWRATHRLLARSAAIKLVRPELVGAGSAAEAGAMLRRFRREAQATAALNSPHTIRLFDFGVTQSQTFYYVMELLSGRDLESLVKQFGPARQERALFLLRQVCHSLAEAHEQGLIHRDITPSNVYVTRMGLDYDFVKVLDFGLVSFAEAQSVGQSLMTGRHTTVGTPAFMAPEMILDGTVDARADIYSFGCVAYYLLTGQLVFDADSPMKMFVQHLQSVPVPPSRRSELPISPEVDALVMSCLEKDPSRRPPSIADVVRRIDQIAKPGAWTNDLARGWWERHLIDLAAVRPDPSVAA
ncbi:MAG: serine/threonine-protein kinase [Vicinamibacterales bacterium]